MKPTRPSRIAVSRWLVCGFLTAFLTACPSAKPELTLTITKPTADLTTNTNVPITLEIPGHTPDQFTALNVVLERKRASDPDTAYEPIANFDRTKPYPFTKIWDVKAEADGAYALRAKATYTGGGFSSDTFTITSDPRKIVLDRQAPTITERTPAPDAKNVSVRTPIKVTFSRPVLTSSLMDASVKLSSNGTGVARTLALSADGKTLTITPESLLSAPSKLEVALSDGITDVVGNKLSSAGTWSWDVPAFLPVGDPLVGITGSPKARQPALAIDPSGNPVVAFTDGLEITNKRVFVQRWDGTRWQPLGGALSSTLSNAGSTSAPALVVDASGRPTVAWMQNTLSFRTFVNVWDGGTWKDIGNPRESTYNNISIAKPLLALDNDNEIVASTFTEESDPSCTGLCHGPTINLFSLNRLSNSSWQTLSNEPIDFEANSLIFDSKNAPIMAGWSKIFSPYRNTIVRKLESGKWSQVGSFESLPGFVLPSLSLDRKGALSVVWGGSAQANPGANLRISQWENSNWKDFSTPFSNGSFPTLIFDKENKPIAAWLVSQSSLSPKGSEINHIFFTRWDGVKWQTVIGPVFADSGLTTINSEAQLKIDSSGTPIMAWSEENSLGDSKVYVYRFNR